jgi:hypothetical protein
MKLISTSTNTITIWIRDAHHDYACERLLLMYIYMVIELLSRISLSTEEETTTQLLSHPLI